MQEVLVYLDPRDSQCRDAIAFLEQHGVGFRTRDTSEDPEALRELRYIGTDRIPTIVVNGVAVEGFDPQALLEILGLGA